ncbi:hypothetical protein BRC90_10300 [Halobacteriales archaeon QS_4_69_34]|nr:MAG: hypothetical protein BRC90_10300 [Halobacteriales archaeon QS_4_69_34]
MRSDDPEREPCGCEPTLLGDRLVVDATGCPADGRLADSPACRASVVGALATRDAESVCVRVDGAAGDTERVYGDGATALLVAAGRFVALAEPHDTALAARARRDPLGAARAAAARSGPVARIAAEVGLVEGGWRVSDYDDALEIVTRDECRTRSAQTANVDRQAANATHVCRRDELVAMFHEVADAGELAPDEVRARYDEQLRIAIDERGVGGVADASGVPRETIDALEAGESPDLTLEDGASVLGARESEPDADAIVAETRDHLLMGMSTAVLDVEAVESGIDGALDAREIQQKIEGRLPMTLDELATIHGYIDDRKP